MAYHPLVHPVAAVDPLVMNFAMAVASQSGNTQAMLRLVAGGESTNDVELNSTSFDGKEFSDKVNAKKRNLHKTKFAFYFELYGMNSVMVRVPLLCYVFYTLPMNCRLYRS
jgi:hypothetical protein